MPIMNPDDAPYGGWPDPAAAGRHLWHDFESETESSADGSGEPDVHWLTIAEPHGEELATITHRASAEYPLDGETAELKRLHAQWIAQALDRTPVPMPTLDDARDSLAGRFHLWETEPALNSRLTELLAEVMLDRADCARECGRVRDSEVLERAADLLKDPENTEGAWENVLEQVIHETAERLTHP